MAKLVNMLERYRSCSQELRQLYLDSQDSLENKTRAIEGLKLELQAARRESETLSARCHAIMEKTTTEIAALKAQLETSRATITAFGDTEKFLLETKARVVEEKSASLALRSQIKRMESEIQQVNAECEKKLKAVESSYKVKLEVLLSTVSELEEFKEDASRMGKENIKLKQTNAVLGLRVKDLESELDSVTSERNKDQSELMKDNTRLGKQVLEYETQKWLLEEQILAHKRQIDSLEQRVGSYVQTNTELRDLVNRLSEQRKTESSETDISEELARVRGEVKILTLDLENERSKISRMQTKITRLEQRKAALKQERAKMVELFKNKLRHAS
jgi:chromosome segregation ATPase